MNSIKGTKTEKNILTAFVGESQARNKYTYFASIAKKEGYEQIAGIFLETADNEKEHAKMLFKLLEGGEVTISETFPAGIIGDTKTNLKTCIMGENHEHTEMYPSFARIAGEEGFPKIAAIFLSIGVAEKYHEKRFAAMLEMLENDTMFKKDSPVEWKCRNCGFVHKGTQPPVNCPACNHPTAYFEVFVEKY